MEKTPLYCDDLESFKRLCYWWPEIFNYIDLHYPVGWHFKEAYDGGRDARKFLVILENTLKTTELSLEFDRSTGSMQVFESISPLPGREGGLK